MSNGSAGRSRSFRVGSVVVVILSAALVVGSLPAVGSVPITETGKRGIIALVDTEDNPAALCVYDGPQSAGNGLDLIEARSPRVFARNRTSARDGQWVGIRLIFQRSKLDGGNGGWMKVKQTKLIKKFAYDNKAVGIGKRSWIANYPGQPHFRVVARINWYKPGSKTKISGSSKIRYQWYQIQFPGITDPQQDRCLPEP